MERTAVTSSNIDEIGYDSEEMTLEVAFSNGSTYRYYNVTADVHAELMAAPSVGRFLAQRIKGVYSCEQVFD